MYCWWYNSEKPQGCIWKHQYDVWYKQYNIIFLSHQSDLWPSVYYCGKVIVGMRNLKNDITNSWQTALLFLTTNVQNQGPIIYPLWGEEERESQRSSLPTSCLDCLSAELYFPWTSYQCCIQCHSLQMLSHLMGLLGNRHAWHRQHILIQKLLPVYFNGKDTTSFHPLADCSLQETSLVQRNKMLNTWPSVNNECTMLMILINRKTPLGWTVFQHCLWIEEKLSQEETVWVYSGNKMIDLLVRVVKKEWMICSGFLLHKSHETYWRQKLTTDFH